MGTSFYGERASGHRALRRGRVSIPGQSYLVTFTTHQRAQIFKESGNAALMARSLHGLKIWGDTKLLAWVLMPDHLHLLITLSQAETLQGVVQKVKSNTARELKSNDLSLGQVWASAFHDRSLRRDEDIRDVARYMVLNPVRAGLVACVGGYPYWDAVWI
ncbi:transposase [Pseudoxanthomonas sp. CF125]|uniref:REP-associated tyrosine transposase n=1 Tax=Pseudoxanthomonas sp. CF125 TaxID=1855303 RepID=UPI0008892186|nr:transposase [Pseudoxanthomonas sp. CF125]SDQ78579.1 REP element-mobilizing transposase RayT [Pseudoxanthomonas sp. CF125]